MPVERFEFPGFCVSVEPMGPLLRAHVFGGQDSLEVSIAMWRFLAEQCEHRGASRLLVVEDLEGTLEVAEIEQLIESIAYPGFQGVRVAFVDLRMASSADEHGEILALERGVSVRVFTQEATARTWLLLGDTPNASASG